MRNPKVKDVTAEFLRCISDHLSGRKNCRRVEYEVYIGYVSAIDIDDLRSRNIDLKRSNLVYFFPKRDVYPDIYHRRRGDAVDIITHVFDEHFQEIVDDDSPELVSFKEGTLTPGVYKYVLSFDGKKRQWIKKL